MSLLERKHQIESFKSPVGPKIRRTAQSYRDMYESTVFDLTYFIEQYRNLGTGNTFKHQLCRHRIEMVIKRYQRYCIAENIKSHYNQKGISLLSKDVTIEHVIPARVVRDMLLSELINIDQALNSPICRVSKKFDHALRNTGLVKMTPNAWSFFDRYIAAAKSASIDLPEFETYNGKSVDTSAWDLYEHYNYFNITVD